MKLTREELEQAVKSFTVEFTEEMYLQKVSKLPKKFCTLLRGVDGLDAKGAEVYDWTKQSALRQESARKLGRLKPAEQRSLIHKFLPHLTDDLVAGLGYLRSLKTLRPWMTGDELDLPIGEWLKSAFDTLLRLDPKVATLEWLAVWTEHLQIYYLSHAVAPMLVAAINKGDTRGREFLQVLIDSANREHEIGVMGAMIPEVLLQANDEKGWSFIEKMLLAAQRQEGLRQMILGAITEAHPQAFRRMIQLIVDEKLARFSAVAQFLNTLLGYQWDSASVGVINKVLEQMNNFLVDKKARLRALKGDDAEAAFLAVFALRRSGGGSALPYLKAMVHHANVEVRYLAAKLLQQSSDEPEIIKLRIACLRDEDQRVALRAMTSYRETEYPAELAAIEFSALEKLLPLMPIKRKELPPLVWPWEIQVAHRNTVARALIESFVQLPPARLLAHIPSFGADERSWGMGKLHLLKPWTEELRAFVVASLADASPCVRAHAYRILREIPLRAEEILQVELLLKRRTTDTRECALNLLLKQPVDDALISAERLLAAGQAQQRMGGLEILRRLSDQGEALQQCLSMASEWQAGRKKLSREEAIQCEAILDAGKPCITLEDGLGFFDPAKLSRAAQPTAKKVKLLSKAAVQILIGLDKLVEQHAEAVVEVQNWDGTTEEQLLGHASLDWPDWDKPANKQARPLPLKKTWTDWWKGRPKSSRDTDGFAGVRALKLLGLIPSYSVPPRDEFAAQSAAHKTFVDAIFGTIQVPQLKYESQVQNILYWLLFLFPPKGQSDFELDCAEQVAALVPAEWIQKLTEPPAETSGYYHEGENDFRQWFYFYYWQGGRDDFEGMNRKQLKRFWSLCQWRDRPVDDAARNRPSIRLCTRAYSNKFISLDDYCEQMIGPREVQYGSCHFKLLNALTHRKLHESTVEFLNEHPEVVALVEGIRARVLDIELTRGELDTAASAVFRSIGAFYGSGTLIRLLEGLGKKGFAVGRSDAKGQALTALVGRLYPGPDDTPAQFAKDMNAAIRAGRFSKDRLLEMVFLAPQWLQLIESYFKWDGMAEACYWFLAHMEYVGDAIQDVLFGTEYDEDVQEGEETQQAIGWDRLILQRTPIGHYERSEGVVDVQWFREVHQRIGKKRFDELSVAARFASTPGWAKRARYIAEVLTGTASRSELIAKIEDRKLKEHVRLLGLLPLAKGRKRETDLQERYQILQDYHRYANGLSSLSRPDALRASEIGMENMARTAGFRDPLRMQWAMEAEATKDLAKGFIEATHNAVTLRMELDTRAMPLLQITKEGKTLKSIPAKLRKHEAFVAIKERAARLKKQARLVRSSLETAMCKEDAFSGSELRQLAGHAVLWPLLQRLVLVGDGLIGYPDKKGKSLRSHDGQQQAVKPSLSLRIAHPVDLLETGAWAAWQEECLASERVQPFKQLFRELYLLTAQEKKSKTESLRYAGQQINPKQAMALWGARAWHTEDAVWKAFPDRGLTADVSFEFNWGTAAEFEGLTIDAIRFGKRETYKKQLLKDVPPILFSEVMRDLDLVVSVAHRGEVDPEASASTTEMRGALILMTARLLGLKNVKLKKSFALIKGSLGSYSIHLGSGEVHLMPGGHVWIVPVHAQHRGRLFLPFADDDPKTAEILSKILLLARDEEIQDPTILSQIRGKRR